MRATVRAVRAVRAARLGAVASLVAAALACGAPDSVGDHTPGTTDRVIGDPCTTHLDCLERCVTDPEDFPGGFCTISCARDEDCPPDAVCIEKQGGICLFTCTGPSAFDCRFLGAGWTCDDRDRASGGRAYVCIGD